MYMVCGWLIMVQKKVLILDLLWVVEKDTQLSPAVESRPLRCFALSAQIYYASLGRRQGAPSFPSISSLSLWHLFLPSFQATDRRPRPQLSSYLAVFYSGRLGPLLCLAVSPILDIFDSAFGN